MITAFSAIWWQLLILVVCSYFLGNLNVAIIVSRARKKDITKEGSGNPGAMNIYRNFGFLPALLTLLLDMVKGLIPALAGWLLFKDLNYTAQLSWGLIAMFIAGFAVVIGHVYPVLRKFKGGKGVASTLGVYFTATSVIGYWYVGLIAFLLGVMYIFFFEWGSVGSLIMTTSLPIFEIVYFSVKYSYSFGLLLIIILNVLFSVLSYWKHRTNLKKLAVGKENRTILRTLFKRKVKNKNKETEQNPENNNEKN